MLRMPRASGSAPAPRAPAVVGWGGGGWVRGIFPGKPPRHGPGRVRRPALAGAAERGRRVRFYAERSPFPRRTHAGPRERAPRGTGGGAHNARTRMREDPGWMSENITGLVTNVSHNTNGHWVTVKKDLDAYCH